MLVKSITEVRSQLGAALTFDDLESLLVHKGNKELCMVFSAHVGRLLVLGAYSSGVASKSEAMHLLGLKRYGDLLDALAEHEIKRPYVRREKNYVSVSDFSNALARRGRRR